VRPKWRRPEWEAPSTVQLRVLPARNRTTPAFHQVGLCGPARRVATTTHWDKVFERRSEAL
jgi:hypothetical protein